MTEKKVKKKNFGSFGSYIHKVLIIVHPWDVGISGEAKSKIDSMIHDLLEQFAVEATNMAKRDKRVTIESKDISAATKTILPGELAKLAVREGTKAVTKKDGMVVPSAPKTGKTGKQKPKITLATRAGLQFPAGRVLRMLKETTSLKRVSENAGVFLAAVLEYMTAEVLELAGNATRYNKRKRITQSDLTWVVKNDEELKKLLSSAILGGGVLPHIHKQLLPKKKDA